MPVLEKEKSESKPVKFRLKIDLCHILPGRTGWVNRNYDKQINVGLGLIV